MILKDFNENDFILLIRLIQRNLAELVFEKGTLKGK